MAKKNFHNNAASLNGSIAEKSENALSPEVADVLAKVRQLLDQGTPEKAFDIITRSRLSSPWLVNATGVCALRIGNAKQAAGVFQGLVGHLGVMLKADSPRVFKTNFAVALLASNNTAGCLSVLHEIHQEDHPTVQRLRAAIAQWRRGLSLWQRLKWYTGDIPTKPVPLDFPLGELE
ncbi:MAG: hypothetical protein ABFC77_11390 [Thermoguttaceae bacterium]